jgi:phosphate transport system substrate-binding protein
VAQVLSGDLLARIFSGSITSWADPAILALNTNLTSSDLPDVPITMSYTETSIGTAGSQVFKTALSTFSASFAQQLDAAGGLLANLPPTSSGTAIRYDNPSERIAYVKVWSPSSLSKYSGVSSSNAALSAHTRTRPTALPTSTTRPSFSNPT